MLDTFTAMADMNSYAELLERLGEKPRTVPMEASWWQRRIQEGLQQDPGNLDLLVLAEKVGMDVPLPQEDQIGNTPIMTAKMALALVSRNPDPQYGMAILWRAITQTGKSKYPEWGSGLQPLEGSLHCVCSDDMGFSAQRLRGSL